MSLNLFALVFGSTDYQADDLVRLREEVQEGSEDRTVIGIDLNLAAHHGIEINSSGMPDVSSLEAWHRIHNPHLFE